MNEMNAVYIYMGSFWTLSSKSLDSMAAFASIGGASHGRRPRQGALRSSRAPRAELLVVPAVGGVHLARHNFIHEAQNTLYLMIYVSIMI